MDDTRLPLDWNEQRQCPRICTSPLTIGAKADDPSICLSLCVSLSRLEFRFAGRETAVPPNCGNETRARRSRQMPHEFVSTRKLSLLDSRKVAEPAEEFAPPERQKTITSQILSSWRRGVGFEPTIRFPVYTLSKRAPSATRPSLRRSGCVTYRPGSWLTSVGRAVPAPDRVPCGTIAGIGAATSPWPAYSLQHPPLPASHGKPGGMVTTGGRRGADNGLNAGADRAISVPALPRCDGPL